MNTLRLLFTVLSFVAAVISSFLFAGSLAQAEAPRPSPAHTPQAANTSTLDTVLEQGILRVGVSLFTPWTMKTPDGRLVGFEIDVAKQLAKDLGVTPDFQVLDWDNIIPALLNRDIDIIIAGIVITPQRALKVNFSRAYHSSGIGLVTNTSLTRSFKGPNDLNRPDVLLASVSGTISEDLARRLFPKATIKTFSSSEESLQAVMKGTVHGYVEHEPITTFLALDHPELVDEPLTKPLLETKAGFAVNKGDPDFLNFLNAWIIAHEADTWLASAHKYWFESLEWRKDLAKAP